MSEIRTLKQYKTTIASCQFIMENGKYIYFKNGRYATDDAAEIEFLEKQIETKHPHLYVQEGEEEITSDVLADPLAEIKKKAIAEFIAQQAAGKDFGNSDQSGKGILTTAGLQNVKESLGKK